MKHTFILTLLAFICYTSKAQTDANFIVKPYLQIGSMPSLTSLQVLWHTSETDADWAVEVKMQGKSTWEKVESPKFKKITASNISARRIYNVTIQNLVSNQEFSYRVLKAGKQVFESIAKPPKTADQAFRFIAFGDIGAGSPEQKTVAFQAYTSKPDLVTVTGDIVYDRGLMSEYDTRFWPIYNASKADSLGVPMMSSVPFVCATGNHDTDTRDLDKYPDALAYYVFWNQPLNGPTMAEGSAVVPKLIASDANRKALIDAAAENYPKMTNFSFDYGNAHWTVIDSNPYVDWTNKEILEWVANDLEASKNATWHFVMFHHPGFNSAREHYEQQHMRLLSPIFEKGNVDVVFNGHVHNYQRSFPMKFIPDNKGTLMVGGKENKVVRGRVVNGKWTLDKTFDGKTNTSPKGIIYIVTGAGGQDLYNPEQNNDPDSWQKFTDKFVSVEHSITVADLDGKNLTIRQISAKGKELDSFKISK